MHFLGIRKDVPERPSYTDLYVSTSHWEGLSLSLFEALVMKKSVVVSDVEGVDNVIKDRVNGNIFPFGNSDFFFRNYISD